MTIIGFFDLEPFEKKYLENKLKGTKDKIFFNTKSLNSKNANKYKNLEVVAVFILSKITKDVMDKMPKLKLITTMSTGYDHIDLEEAKKRGIKVTNVPVYGQNTVAEHAFALLQTLNRHIIPAVERTRKGDFNYKGLLGRDLKGQTLGVVGTGHIGEFVIKYAKSFGMKVIASDTRKNKELAKELKFKYVSLKKLCQEADIISLHVPLLESTYHLLGKEEFKQMKKGVIIVNTSRGPLIDSKELIKALDKGIVSGAALDVLELESDIKKEAKLIMSMSSDEKRLLTLVENHELLQRENVIITPHLAFYTEEAIKRILDTTLKNIHCYKKGRLKNKVR